MGYAKKDAGNYKKPFNRIIKKRKQVKLNPAYVAFVKTLPCCHTGQIGVDPHHIAQDRLKELFDYSDGKLIRKLTLSSRAIKGMSAGSKGLGGYLFITIDGRNYRVHRLIYLMVHGYIPACIDHIDRNPSNNKIENLRAATTAENIRNQKKRSNNTSGVRGVSWSRPSRKWRARLKLNYKEIHIGFFVDKTQAERAIINARCKYYGDFA